MKTKIIITCGLTLLFLTTSVPLFAIDSNPSVNIKKPANQPSKEIRKVATQEIKIIRQETKTDIQTLKLQNKRKEISTSIGKQRVNIVSRYERIIADKAILQSKINERKAKGLNTTAAESKLVSFSTAEYVTHLSTFDTQTALAVASTRPYAQSPELKSSFKALNTDLLNLRKILTQTITVLVSNKTKVPTATTGAIKK